ncbi:MAG: hypothetical protein P4M07_11630 [Xanthobacteraceae bacterium]|nr:hypothetical protein [Xanthobacteraceae bacterium]
MATLLGVLQAEIVDNPLPRDRDDDRGIEQTGDRSPRLVPVVRPGLAGPTMIAAVPAIPGKSHLL